MISGSLLFLIALLLGLGFWYSNLRAKELALEAAKQLCLSEGVQLLDDSVIGYKLGLSHCKLLRYYRFDYHNGNNVRYQGYINICQNQIISQKLTISSNRIGETQPAQYETAAKVLDFALYRDNKRLNDEAGS